MGRSPSKRKTSEAVYGANYYAFGGTFGYQPRGEYLEFSLGMPMARDLRRMFLMDDTVGAMTWVMSTTLQQTRWKHVPQVDGEDALNDEKAVEMARFADTLLLDMGESWASHVEQCCEMLWSGYLPFEIVTKQRDGKNSRFKDYYYGIRKLPLLDPLSVNGWVYDNEGDVTHIMQSGANRPIPIWKVNLYATFATEANPAGRSMLQGAWRSWHLKTKVQDSEAIGIDRDLCGLPVFKVPESLLEQADEIGDDGKPTIDAQKAQARIQRAIKAVSDMRFNRSGGLLMPSDTFSEETDGDRTPMYDFKLVSTAGQRSIDTRTVIRDYDRSISRIAMMQFLHLGDRSTGSYGLSDDQSSMAMRSLTAFANIISNEWNRKVLSLLWDVNVFDNRYRPAMRPNEISKEGLTAMGTWLRGVGAVAELWKGDEDARDSIAKVAGFRLDKAAQKKAAKATFEAQQPRLPGLPAPGGNDGSDQ